MRRAGLLAALLLALLLTAWDPVSPRSQVRRVRPPAPTAAEEAGGDGALESPVRYPPAVTRRPEPRRPARITPLHAPPRTPRHLESSTPAPASEPENGAAAVVTEGPTREQEVGRDAGAPSAGSIPGSEDRPAEGSAVSPPVLTPPVLATGALGYPDGYQLILSRGTLMARLLPEAVEGRVVLRVLVLADGSVARIEVAESSGQPPLDEAAVHAARTWIFLPATRGGMPIDAWAVIPLRFVVR